MSYRGFKRVLGESSLERKCRWWFGVTLGVLLALSFYWSGQKLRDIVRESDVRLGPELVRAAWLQTHFSLELKYLAERQQRSGEAQAPTSSVDAAGFYRELLDSGDRLGTDFDAYSILPQGEQNPERIGAPQFDWEENLFRTYAEMDPPAEGEAIRHVEHYDDEQNVFRYYQPLYATAQCADCHRHVGTISRTGLAEGDLMALVRIEMDQGETRDDIAKYDAIMWGVALTIGVLSMFLLYFIVRYVIVKPVQHLQDVANAVREGDIEKRAEINTRDEFEELAAAFNRMLRQLLRQQDALKEVNGELDGKIDELAQLNLRLFEMNRLKSDFLATMSHELRTPLNSILGFSDVLGSIKTLDDKQRRYVGNIQRSGKMLLEMINDILDLAKMESGRMGVHPTDFPVEAVVVAQSDMARPLSERKNIDLESDCPAGLPLLRQDQAKLQQVLNNLLSNAIKFTPEGGRIMVRVRREMERGVGWLLLEVEDTGIGIGPEDQAIVFEKFRQGASAAPRGDAMTREQGGTGLGLSIVRELCRLLGGEISLSSVVGKGSTFTVRLPWRLTPRADAELDKGVADLTRPMLPPQTSAMLPAPSPPEVARTSS
ncbi:sensor histidine kinase [Botrimarina hoheduenensis]|uniref:histidine kinase n=1 Tax=Botrimarina hoheduenensis TaxID=2528000 RepID=A0A5C5VXK9_9BACT|nr:HAMP domain-containing sensor histidine kinase [Botrimarina hoheduenensis]TWT43378.1 Autoinducer 2 sensor kinase/phosphatase LuxQ [Botrimarina hoheduenensis]